MESPLVEGSVVAGAAAVVAAWTRSASTNADARVSWLVGAFYQRARQHLHGHVLKGEAGAMEQLQHEQTGAQLLQGRHRRMAEGGVGFRAEVAKGRLVDGVAAGVREHEENE